MINSPQWQTHSLHIHFSFSSFSIFFSPDSITLSISSFLSFTSPLYIPSPSLSIFLKDSWLKIACWHLRVLCHLISYKHRHTHTYSQTVINVFLHHLELKSSSWQLTWSPKKSKTTRTDVPWRNTWCPPLYVGVYCVSVSTHMSVWSVVNQNSTATDYSVAGWCTTKKKTTRKRKCVDVWIESRSRKTLERA